MHAFGVAFDSCLETATLITQYLKQMVVVYGLHPQGAPGAVCMSRMADFGRILYSVGESEKRSALVQQSVDWFNHHPPEEASVWGACLLNLGVALVQIQQSHQAIEWLEQACKLRRRVHGPDSMRLPSAKTI